MSVIKKAVEWLEESTKAQPGLEWTTEDPCPYYMRPWRPGFTGKATEAIAGPCAVKIGYALCVAGADHELIRSVRIGGETVVFLRDYPA